MTQYASALDTNGDGSYDGEMELVGTLINYVLSGIFAVELAISLYAHWWRPFFTSGWKIFDLVIVIISLLALTSWTPIPPEVARAMRIFRVFGTAESLRRIISPLVSSLIPVANAFAILFVVVAFGAINAPPPRSTPHTHTIALFSRCTSSCPGRSLHCPFSSLPSSPCAFCPPHGSSHGVGIVVVVFYGFGPDGRQGRGADGK